MAYFIVIGTNNDVKEVVDGIKHSHLQHNVVTSGCILNKDQGLYYHWDVYNAKGDKTNESNDNKPIDLHDALTNQIAQFKSLLPEGQIPYVFIVSTCLNETDRDNLLMVCDELNQVGGARFNRLLVNIVIVGYDLKQHTDVTIRPDWGLLKSLRGLGINQQNFNTNILYINNMDYQGAATNIESQVLSRFLCHWSKMKTVGGWVNSTMYSIGMSEHQYDFRDLNEFFKLAAEEKLLERTLNSTPSPATQERIDTNYYKQIDLSLDWIDGLYSIKSIWESYCSTTWNPSLLLPQQNYSVARQEQELATYLNQFLKLYVDQEKKCIAELNEKLLIKRSELGQLSQQFEAHQEEIEEETVAQEEAKISKLQTEISKLLKRIDEHEVNIAKNTFLDAGEFHQKFGPFQPITEEDQSLHETKLGEVTNLIDYVKSGKGINTMRKAIERATTIEELPSQSLPTASIKNIGWVKSQASDTPTQPQSAPTQTEEEQSQRTGCLAWIMNWFTKQDKDYTDEGSPLTDTGTPVSPATIQQLGHDINECVQALKKVDEVRQWWNDLCQKIDTHQTRKDECRLLMDGETDLNGRYLTGREGYAPPYHTKSVSLIDMDRVRHFRDTDGYYHRMLQIFLDRWFDHTAQQRMTMLELIKHQVLDPLVGKYHTLKWDGSNPFVKELLSDEEMHTYIEHDIQHSKLFVEYVNIQNHNITQDVSIAFYSNNPNIPEQAPQFRQQYTLGANSIVPKRLNDFVNSLCVVQVMGIGNPVEDLRDFKPKRTAEVSRLQSDITNSTLSIIHGCDTIEKKAKAIYEWLCQNISYDTTKQIHDAETCWRTKRGVCQAYCELFCHMADIAGFTADIIVGNTKGPDGEIPEEKHAWIYVYTNGYDGILIDPTWGAGAVDKNNRFIKNTDTSIWFNVSPYWMIFSHFPDNEEWTKLEGFEVTEEQFKQLPYKDPTKSFEDGKNLLFETISNLAK